MTSLRMILAGLCLTTTAVGTMAQGTDEHKDHHPAGTAAPAVAIPQASSPAMRTEKMVTMEQHMKDMQAMHEKMMSTKTPEERQALMTEHMKMMQDGMAMMKQMGGMSKMGGKGGKGMGGMSERQQMMEKRMDMMESMMQMMMDRMQSPPSAARQ